MCYLCDLVRSSITPRFIFHLLKRELLGQVLSLVVKTQVKMPFPVSECLILILVFSTWLQFPANVDPEGSTFPRVMVQTIGILPPTREVWLPDPGGIIPVPLCVYVSPSQINTKINFLQEGRIGTLYCKCKCT